MRKIHLKFFVPEVDEDNAVGKLFKVFFEYQHEDDEFSISEKLLTLNVAFEEFPEQIITAISELPFSNVKYLSIEEVQNEQNSPQNEAQYTACQEGNVQEESTPIQTEKDEEKTKVHKKRQGNRKHQEMDEAGLQIVDKIAKESSSFEDFIQKMGKFIGINEQSKGFYVAMLKTACNVEPITITEISNNMESFGEPFNAAKKVTISSAIKKAFEAVGSNARLMTVLEEIVKYKTHSFSENAEKLVVSENDGEKTLPEVVVSGEDEKHKSSENVEFKTVSEEILRKLYTMKGPDFSTKFGVDESSYLTTRDAMVKLIEKTANDVSNGNKLQESLANNAQEYFKNKAHIALAFIYQSIKNYCQSIGFEDASKDVAFTKYFINLID